MAIRPTLCCLCLFIGGLAFSKPVAADNQTPTVTPVLSSAQLPFQIKLEKASLQLPVGFHSGAFATHRGKWLLVAGRTNGLHGFESNTDNFPPSSQNRSFIVVDPSKGKVYSRSLEDPQSGLTAEQIDQLSVTSPQFFQKGDTLYLCGGYGVNSEDGSFSTKDVLTAIDVPGMIRWVMFRGGKRVRCAAELLRQTSNPYLQVTGGYMDTVGMELFALLIFGQNFQGFYSPSSNGQYTQQVRPFQIIDTGKELYVVPKMAEPPNESYRRRDLNVLPVLVNRQLAFVALSGVFTLTGGAWTVPVFIQPDGSATMANPEDPATFKQAMNNYVCASLGLYSDSEEAMYGVLLGGISYGFFRGGLFMTDSELPFINQLTTIRIDQAGHIEQFLMEREYPFVPSPAIHRGHPLLFGAGAFFIPCDRLPQYSHGILQLDRLLDGPRALGYVVGGIMSTKPNTDSPLESTGSPYLFKVFLEPRNGC